MKGEYSRVGTLNYHVIDKDDYELKRNGFVTKSIYASISLDLTKLGEFPLGTIKIHAYNENFDKSIYFYSMNEVDFNRYDGQYSTELTPSYNATGLYGFNIAVTKLSSVYNDWMTLVNLLCYVRSAVKGGIDLSLFSRYIPGRGEIIQAWMYNALLDNVADCAREVGVWTNVPPYVASGNVIPKDFIQVLGNIANACIRKKLSENSSKLGRYS